MTQLGCFADSECKKEKLQDISSEDIEKEGVWLPGTLDPQNEFVAMWNESLSPRKKRNTHGAEIQQYGLLTLSEYQIARWLHDAI